MFKRLTYGLGIFNRARPEEVGFLRFLPPLLVFFLIYHAFSPLSAFGQAPPSEANHLESDLQTDLNELLRQGREVLADLSGNVLPARKVSALLALFDRVHADDLLIRERQMSIEGLLREKGASGAILGRQTEMGAVYRQEVDQIFEEMGEVARAATGHDLSGLRSALDRLTHHLETWVAPKERIPLAVNLPYRSLDLPQIASQLGGAITPAYLDRTLSPPAAADLAEGPEVLLTSEILAQARTLHQNPIEIFEFVQNQIEMEFYYGAMKGAAETLRERRGNDVDQASLLIALMRASGVPARYVRGVIDLSGPQALSWTALSTTRRAAELFTRAGIPFRPIQQGGTIGSFQLEHTWVEIDVPYSNYRGAPLDAAGKAWIPLDPSIKSYQYDTGTDLLAAIEFKADLLVQDYLSALQALSPVDFYKKKVTDYLTLYRPDLTYDQVVGKKSLLTASMGLLPSTLPYPTVSVNQEGAALSEDLRHKVRFIAEGEGGTSLDVTLPASELLGRRLTLSYVPATVEDQVAVDAFISLDNTPAYLIKLRPVIKVGGVVRGAGELPVQMGALHNVRMEIETPRGSVSISNSLLAGGYYAIGLGLQKSAYVAPSVPAPEDTEYEAADLLYRQASDYLEGWNAAERSIADILRIVNIRPALSEVMIGNVYNRTVLFGRPQAIDWRGVFVDADLRISEPIPVGADDARKKEFMRLSGLAGSMLESEILERNLEVDAVSAAKVIQLARAAGIPVDEIDASNVGTALPLLQTAESVKTEIADAVNQGWHATIPRTDLTRNIWSGTGYILLDPATGNGGYFISGFLAGAVTDQENWVKDELKNAFKFANTPRPNTDPTAAAFIEKIPAGDKQKGTVGKQLPDPIAVWVRDKANRPVKGVDVTFFIQAGGGHFISIAGGIGTFTTVKTDDFGIARVRPYLGERTSDFPFYVKANPTDTKVTQVGQNIVNAKFTVAGGDVYVNIPFQLFGHPDQPDHIRKVLGEGTFQYSGTWAGTLSARVEDRHDNPVSNVDVNFFVRPPKLYSGFMAPNDPASIPYAGPLPANLINVKIYPLGSCANPIPILGQCNGVEALTLKSSIFGVSVEAILGNTFNTKFNVEAAVMGSCAGLCADTFHLYSTGTRNYGSEEYFAPTVQMTALQFVNDKGEVLNATKVGTKFKYPVEIALFVRQDDYTIAANPRRGPTCERPDPPCWIMKSLETRRVRPVDVHRSGTINFPTLTGVAPADKKDETAVVSFAVLQGGGSVAPIPPQNSAGGRHGTYLTVGTTPDLNKVETSALADVWVPYLDGYTGDLKPVMARLAPGQSAGSFDASQTDPLGNSPKPIPAGFEVKLTHEVFGVRATVDPVRNFPTLGDDRFGNIFTTADFDWTYKIEPPTYNAQTADIDFFEVDPAAPVDPDGCHCKWIGLWVGDSKSGTGKARIFQGTGINYKKSFKLQSVLNRGGDVEVKSDKQALVFLGGKVNYTYVKADPAIGLDYAHADRDRRARGVVVKLLDSGGAVLKSINTSERGYYFFEPPSAAGNYRIFINAEMGDPATPHVRVVNNTVVDAADPSGHKLYSFPFDIAWTGTASFPNDVHFKSGWVSGPSYTQPRDAAPFAILDTIYQAEKLIHSADATVVFPLLIVNWSPKNRNQGDAPNNFEVGDIGSSLYRLDAAGVNNLYILGHENDDTDEYDSHVIAHEWAHYIEKQVSRSDTIRGNHGDKDILDPRVAFGEGWAHALSGMVFNDPLYVDTVGLSQGCSGVRCPTINVDANSVPNASTHPTGIRYDGYYAEASVQEVLWDLFDSGAGKVGLGFTPLYQVMVGGQKTTPAFTSVFSFLHYLKAANPAASPKIAALALAENITAGDEYEGDATEKIYTEVQVTIAPAPVVVVSKDAAGIDLQTSDAFGPISATSFGDPPDNKFLNRRFFKFTIAAEGDYTITVTPSARDIFFRLNKKGTVTSIDNNNPGFAETLTRHFVAGTYTMDVGTFSGAGKFTVEIHK